MPPRALARIDPAADGGPTAAQAHPARSGLAMLALNLDDRRVSDPAPIAKIGQVNGVRISVLDKPQQVSQMVALVIRKAPLMLETSDDDRRSHAELLGE